MATPSRLRLTIETAAAVTILLRDLCGSTHLHDVDSVAVACLLHPLLGTVTASTKTILLAPP